DDGAAGAQQAFEDYVAGHIYDYKEERYSGARGKARWWKDRFFDLPEEVNVFYTKGKEYYIRDMNRLLARIATSVAKGLTEAMTRIAQGKREVDKFLNGLSESLQTVGRDAAKAIKTQFDQLEHRVEDKQDEIIDGLVQRYKAKEKELDKRITE